MKIDIVPKKAKKGKKIITGSESAQKDVAIIEDVKVTPPPQEKTI